MANKKKNLTFASTTLIRAPPPYSRHLNQTLEKPTTLIKVLDGKRFYYAFLAGAQRLIENQGIINKINVFPVADADTGTNLASTFRSIVDNPIPTNTVKHAAGALAEAALVGARGNSGIIFAQFLYGFSNEIEKEEEFTVQSFARSVYKAVNYAYEAIANPVEGTMISVIREWAEFIDQMKGLIDDFVELLKQALQVARQSLADTTKKLEVLAKANVVDAGAKGFVLFLEGMIDFFNNKNAIRAINIPMNEMDSGEIPADLHEEITFRYCCEALLSLDRFPKSSKNHLKNSIGHFGDSLVVAGSEKRVRLHIHSDDPIQLFKTISQQADITYQKVDDMVMQQDMASNRKFDIGLFTDSTCDLPQDIIERYQISVIPLNLHSGDSHYLDRMTISNETFYDLLDRSSSYPSTSQPSYKDFINKYSYLCTHYPKTIGIHVSQAMSGTFSNSQRAAKVVSEQSGKPIVVHSSNRVSSALGLIVLRTAKAIENGMAYEQIVEALPGWNVKSKILVSATSVKYLVKSGRLSHSKGMIARMLNVNPLISMNDSGKAMTFGKAYNEKVSMNKVMREARKLLEDNTIWGYAISHIRNPETAHWYAGQMEQLTSQKPRFINECSPVLGVNGGPGTVVLSIMLD